MSNFTLEKTRLQGVVAVSVRAFADERGFFAETWNRRSLAALGIADDFVQDNHSLSLRRGTIRGLHFQKEGAAQAKLVRVLRGAVFDVAVDLREGSPTFGQHAVEWLSAENRRQLYVPVGFAHGFCTLEDDTEVAYKVTDYYSPEHDAEIVWNDPTLAIAWPLEGQPPVLSAKDAQLPSFSDLGYAFADKHDRGGA